MITNVLFIAFLVAVLLLVKYFKSSKGKGKAGEWLVAQVLRQLGPGYEILNNLTFVVEGDSTQIDHVVISTKGIFTIETKNYQGSIFGQASDAKWTQTGWSRNPASKPELAESMAQALRLCQGRDAGHDALEHGKTRTKDTP